MTEPMTGTERPDVSTLSYEQARDELIEIVRSLETGAASLEDSLALWERGEALAARCSAWLDGARARLDAAQQAPTSGPGRSSEDRTAPRESGASSVSANDPAAEEDTAR